MFLPCVRITQKLLEFQVHLAASFLQINGRIDASLLLSLGS